MGTDKKRKFSKAQSGQAKRRKTQAATSIPKRPVTADELSWKAVDVPEMFNDAEGFFGLEVVEGVDVVKDGGKVQFVSFFLLHFLVSMSHVSSDCRCPKVGRG